VSCWWRARRRTSGPPSAARRAVAAGRQGPVRRSEGAQHGLTKGRPLVPARAVGEVVERWQTQCARGRSSAQPTRSRTGAGAPSGRRAAGDGRRLIEHPVPQGGLPRLRDVPSWGSAGPRRRERVQAADQDAPHRPARRAVLSRRSGKTGEMQRGAAALFGDRPTERHSKATASASAACSRIASTAGRGPRAGRSSPSGVRPGGPPGT
jgi:hypothetical protein